VQLKNWIIGLVSGLVLVAFAFMFMINRQKNRAIADRNTIDVLRGELQHRAAGALNTVIALLNIEKRKSAGNASLIALESRVTPLIGLFHSFNTHAGENMSIQKRLGELASFYKGIFNAEYQVDVIIQAPDLTEQRKADKLLLAVGELMLNSYKYAFEKGKQGLIKIDASIDPDNTYLLSYSDNGNGLPDGPIKPKGGLASVKAVVETLNGTLNLVNAAGFRAELKFPV
jgi:two-component sensor histidine kinase